MVVAMAACFVATSTFEAKADTSLKTQYEELMAIIGGASGTTQSGPGGTTSGSTGPGSSPATSSTNKKTTSNGPGASSSSTSTNENPGIVIEGLTSSTETAAASGTTVPVVKEVNPTERYFAEFGIYEEGIDGKYYFYSNTGNGSVTDEAVYVDIPDGMEYTVEHDGVQISYESKALLHAKGSYIFRFRVIHNETQSLSTETEYKATFRFRIDDKLPEAAEGSSTTVFEEEPVISSEIDAYQELIEQMQQEIDELKKPSGGVFFDEDDLKQDAETVPQEPETAEPAETVPVETVPEEPEGFPIGFDAETGLIQKYDDVKDIYTQELLTGSSFMTNVPNGAIVNESVTFLLEDENHLLFDVMKDGEAMEYLPGDPFTEDGEYTVAITGTDASFESLYAGLAYPEYQFRIITKPVNDLKMLTVPKDAVIVSFKYDGAPAGFSGNTVEFAGDGLYEVTYATADGDEIRTAIYVDTQAPAVEVTVENGKAKVVFDPYDAAEIVLYKDGEQVAYPEENVIKEKGSYELHITDEAGNTQICAFTVEKQISVATILLAVMAVALAGALAAFIVKIKKGTSLN